MITPEIRAQVLREAADAVRQRKIEVPDVVIEKPFFDGVEIDLVDDIEAEAKKHDLTTGDGRAAFITAVVEIADDEAARVVKKEIEAAMEAITAEQDSIDIVAEALESAANAAMIPAAYRHLASIRKAS